MLMLSVSAISLVDHIASVLEAIAHATTMLCSDRKGQGQV